MWSPEKMTNKLGFSTITNSFFRSVPPSTSDTTVESIKETISGKKEHIRYVLKFSLFGVTTHPRTLIFLFYSFDTLFTD